MNSFTRLSSSTQRFCYLPEHPCHPFHSSHPESSTWLKRFGQWLLQSLADSNQVRLWTKITPAGIQWYAYDPSTQRRFSCHSEAELRVWLENRYRSTTV
ncbi:MAG: hypothetical protein WA883_04630 [Phormidesmis sp.]